jgi:hypothetical protein
VQGSSRFGSAAVFEVEHTGTFDPPNKNPAILVTTGSHGPANAARLSIENPDNFGEALFVRTSGRGGAAAFSCENPASTLPVLGVVSAQTRGQGVLINTPQTTGLFVSGRPAGVFSGDVHVSGTLTADDKLFVIDHPLDPANKHLVHASVESWERETLYTGNVVLDEDGEAVVALPAWVEALNEDFRYQLTCIGGAAAVYVAQEVSQGSFTISGGSPGMKVSWQLVGIRKDAWAQAHPLVLEADKPAGDKGRYRHPELMGQGAGKSIGRSSNPRL